MNDQKVLAVLIKAGDTTLDQPLGVGALIDRQAAIVVLDEKAEFAELAELEVLITPVPLGERDFVERIKPAALMAGSLVGNDEQFATVRLRHASAYGSDGNNFSRADLRQTLEHVGDGWLAMEKLAGIGPKLTADEISAALEKARAYEVNYSERALERKGERSAAQISRDCCACSSACNEPDLTA